MWCFVMCDIILLVHSVLPNFLSGSVTFLVVGNKQWAVVVHFECTDESRCVCAVIFCVHANVDPDTSVARKQTQGSTPVSPPAPAARPVGVGYLMWKVNTQTHTLALHFSAFFVWCCVEFVLISRGIASHQHCRCQFVQQEIELPSLLVTDWSNWEKMQWESRREFCCFISDKFSQSY